MSYTTISKETTSTQDIRSTTITTLPVFNSNPQTVKFLKCCLINIEVLMGRKKDLEMPTFSMTARLENKNNTLSKWVLKQSNN